MGWVTLTLRKTELKRTHSDYQKQLLDISRTKRRMARESHYQQLLVRNDQQEALRGIRNDYLALRDSYNEQLNDPNLSDSEKANIRTQLEQALEERTFNENEIKAMYEADLTMLEDNANDEETMLDQEQVQIEAQLEAIKAELDAVGEAISSQIQDSTIKLS
ncbi:MAG: hypothetical protein IKU37_04375 [Candidatus Gastranaerophilales bacterium]|nr:hypothetical protein [Candidatus Gastranaerophilales bacterium]